MAHALSLSHTYSLGVAREPWRALSLLPRPNKSVAARKREEGRGVFPWNGCRAGKTKRGLPSCGLCGPLLCRVQ